MYFRSFFAALALATVTILATGDARAADIEVTSAWARPPLTPNGAAAAYVSIRNAGGADRLVGARSPAAKRAMLHTHVMDGNVAKMRHVEAVEVPAGGEIAMTPGGDHVMLMGVQGDLHEGVKFPLTLVFEKGGEVTVDVEVLSAQATGPKPMEHMDHGQAHEHAGHELAGHEHAAHHHTENHHAEHHPMTMSDEVPANLDTATTKLSAHKLFRVTMTHDHPFTLNEMHGCVLTITTPDGAPVEGAEIAIGGGMPAHGHGLPTAPRVTDYLGDGKYRVEGMKFSMTGWWELKFDISAPKADSVTFNLVLE